MGCPGGTRAVFTRGFRTTRELHCIFLEKKIITRISLLHPNTAQRSFFSHNNLFLGKLKKKNWPKKPAYKAMRVYLIVLTPPGHPIQLIQYGRRIGKKVYCLYWLRPKRVPLLSKIVYKRIRGRTSRGSLPVQCIVEYYSRAKPSYDLPHTC